MVGQDASREARTLQGAIRWYEGHHCRSGWIFIFALVVNYVVHLQQNPLTGRSRFISLTPDQIQTIAQIEEEGVSVIPYRMKIFSGI